MDYNFKMPLKKKLYQIRGVRSILGTNEIFAFAMQTLLKVKQICEDYREFLQLVIIFLDGTPRGISFRGPGVFYHARRMAKLIYKLKIYFYSGANLL